MSPVAFLLIALFIAAAGIAIAVMRNRQPSRPENAMEAFRREMQALAPRDRPEGDRSQPSGIIWTASPDHTTRPDHTTNPDRTTKPDHPAPTERAADASPVDEED